MLDQITKNGQHIVTITAITNGEKFTLYRPVVQVERTLRMLDECGFDEIKIED
jgi:hypothetical protein